MHFDDAVQSVLPCILDLVTKLLEQATTIPMLARASGDETLVPRKAER